MKNVDNRELGRQGERIAKEYLVKNGYEILASNYYASHKEIDIIAITREYIVFVEVKCRTLGAKTLLHRPANAVGWRKRSNIAEAANRFMLENCNEGFMTNRCVRVDVIEVIVPPLDKRYESGKELKLSPVSINHIRNAFYSDASL